MTFLRCLLIFILLILPGINFPLYPIDEDNIQSDLRVYIYMDRVSFSDDDPVILRVCIKNNSKSREILKIYDELYTTFQPVVYDEQGKEAELIVPYRMMNRDMSEALEGVSPGIVQLSRDETLEHIINLKDVYKLEMNKEYRVQIRFSPDASTIEHFTGENIFTFRTYKSAVIPEYRSIKRIERTISPSEIVMLFLHAEKNFNWDDYLKYIKLEDYIQAYPEYVREYRNADEIRKSIIIDEFIKFLKKKRSDYILDFQVLDEIIKEKNRAFVYAEIKRYGPRVPFVYRYKYSLERFKSFWRITDVEATVLKGHKL